MSLGLISLLIAALPLRAHAAPIDHDVTLVEIASGMGTLTDLDAPELDNRVFVSDLAGRIWIWERGSILAQPFLDISALTGSGEHGLLSFTFHPDYRANGKIYVHYVNSASRTQIAEYTVSNDPNRIDVSTGRVLFGTNQPASNHNGGSIDFGPDGFLYIALGDGGGQHDPAENGQNINTYLSAILRIDVDSGNPYSIPGDNPFVGAPGLDEIWVYGFRNPWRMSWDLEKNRLYVADVGQDAREEVNVIKPGDAGNNYGWDVMEGSICHEPSSGCNTAGLVRPDLEYGHSQGSSITGGHVYRGRELPRLDGHYFYADWGSGFIRSFKFKNGSVTATRDWTTELGTHRFITSFGTDGFGELYFVTGGGSVYKFASTSPPRCDFDADGYDDLAVGVPGEGLAGVESAGGVNVLLGANKGIKTSGDRFITQDSPGVKDGAEAGDGFGTSLACGDFNGDGYSDLVVGVPAEDVDGAVDAGAVHIFPGGESGLSTGDDQLWTQGSPGVATGTESGDRFGYALATGDFNGDSMSDLAIGVPGEDLSGHGDAGAVHVLFGSPTGLTSVGSELWHQDSGGVRNKVEAGDEFGSSLASGDFDGDGIDDLAIGVPGEDVSGVADAGLVSVLYGRPSGLSAAGDDTWSQATPGMTNPAEEGDRFGTALASGDFDDDDSDDLAIGVPDEGVDGKAAAGAVHVLSGSGGGLTVSGDQFWTQDSPGIANKVEAGDRFGAALTGGDFDGDLETDLAIGAPGEGVSGAIGAGSVSVLRGSPGGLTSAGDQFWSQSSPGINNGAEAGDAFGTSLSAVDHDSDGRHDLDVGVPGEDVAGKADAGMVNVIYGSTGGLHADGDEGWHQDSSGVRQNAEADDQFGFVPTPH